MEVKAKSVEQVLAKLDLLVEPVRKNQEVADTLLDRLKTTIDCNPPGRLLQGSEFLGANRGGLGAYGASSLVGEDVYVSKPSVSSDPPLLSGSTFFHSGSAYEGLAVSKDTDYDISLQLKRPFVSDNFRIEKREEKFFVLLCRDCAPVHPQLAKYVSGGHFKAKELHEDVMLELETLMNRLHIPGRTIYYEKQLRALKILLKCEDEQDVEMDIVPHIPVSSLVWRDCPGLVELGKLPICLQKEIEKMEKNGNRFVFFTPIVSNSAKYDCGEELGELAFSKLEKSFFKSNVKIRDMVRLVKLVANRREWSDLGLKPFHIKRLAIKISDQLDSLTKWDGYKFLLKSIKEELEKTGSMGNYFVKEVRFGIKTENLSLLQRHLDVALRFTTTDLYYMI